MRPFEMALPRTVEGAVKASGDSFRQTKMLAGGTDLLGELKEGTATPERVVNLKTIPGLRDITNTDRGLEIGALVTLSEIAGNAAIQKGWPALVTTIERAATPQIRNVGTLGGNLCQRVRCWYYRDEGYPCLKKGGTQCYAREGENEYHAIFDNNYCCAIHPSNTAPVLIAFGARMDVVGPKGSRTIRVEDFFTAPRRNIQVENVLEPNEVVTRIILPAGSQNRQCVYVETREKQSFDWATCGATVNLWTEGGEVRKATIVLNAVAPTPLRLRDLEKLLRGKRITESIIERVCKLAVKGARPLRDNGYKVALVKAVLARALRQAAQI